MLFSTNAIKSLHTRYQHTVTVGGHFPTEQAPLKCLYLVTRGLDPKGHGSDTMNHAVEAHAQHFHRHPR